MKKAIAAYEDCLDKQAATTYEKDLEKDVVKILELLYNKHDLTTAKAIIKVLVGKNIISLQDFKTILGE